jgi:hypothetical protein
VKFLALALAAAAAFAQPGEDWLTWPASRAMAIGKAAYVTGRVGRLLDTRLLKTERSQNYKLAATWMTPDVIHAAARVAQLTDRLTDDEAQALVTAAEATVGTTMMIEIDPREGSGVIPLDWSAFLQPTLADGTAGRPVRGVNTPALREVKALSGTLRRNYDYDRFWMVFPLTHADGAPLFPPGATGAELVVRIHDREGRVKWPRTLR